MTGERLWQRVRAAVSCGLATAADFATLTLLVQIAGLGVLAAASAGASVGALVNFFVQRHHVYQATGERKRRQLPRYLAVAITTMAISAGATTLLAEWVGVHYLIARAMVAVVVFLLWHEPLARRAFGARSASRRAHDPGDEALLEPEPGGELMTTSPYLSVIVPAYNECQRLPATLADIQRILSLQQEAVEVIVVDDGSTDGTDEVVKAMTPSFPALHLVRYEQNRGKGYAVKQGVLASRGEVVLFMDADNSVPLDHADALLAHLGGGVDAAIGSRYLDPGATRRRQPWYRVLWSRIANVFVQRILLDGIADTQCGFKAFRAGPAKRVFSQLTITGWGFDLEVLTLLDRMGYSIVEVPVAFTDDRRTRINPLVDLWAVVGDFLRVQRNLWLHRYDLSLPAHSP